MSGPEIKNQICTRGPRPPYQTALVRFVVVLLYATSRQRVVQQIESTNLERQMYRVGWRGCGEWYRDRWRRAANHDETRPPASSSSTSRTRRRRSASQRARSCYCCCSKTFLPRYLTSPAATKIQPIKTVASRSQRVSLIVIPGCLSGCLSVIPRPTAYHD